MATYPDNPPSYQSDREPRIPTAQPAPDGKSYGSVQPAQPVTVVYSNGPSTFGGIDPHLEHQRLLSTTVKWLRYIPCMHICPAILFFIFNVTIPGTGTILACLIPCCSNTAVKSDSMGKILCITFWFGLLQLITCPIVIGYILASLWSYGTMANYRLYYKRQIEMSEVQAPVRPTYPSYPSR